MSAKKKTFRLVIDADIAHSAGESQHPDSSNCRKFLESVHDNKHILIMTGAIREEWNRHQSRYSRRWRKLMFSRGQFEIVRIDENEKIEKILSDFGLTETQEKIALKDSHLIDTAVKSDKIIASADDTARNVFSIAAIKAKILKNLIWVNPKKIASELTVWLEGGKTEKEWQLRIRN